MIAETIVTNHVPRFTIDAFELSDDERSQFDYLDWDAIDRGEDSASFVRYRGWLYDVGEFVRVDDLYWHGIATDTFFSGVLIRLVDDETVVMGMAFA